MEIKDDCESVRVLESGLGTGDILIRLLNEGNVALSDVRAEFDLFLRWEQGDQSGTRVVKGLTASVDGLGAGESKQDRVSLNLEYGFYPERQVENAKVECEKE